MALLLALFLAAGISWAGQMDEDIDKKIMGAKTSLNRLKLSLDSTETYLQKLDKRHKSAAQYLEPTKGALDTLPTKPELEQNIHFQREVCLIPARKKDWPTEKYEKIITEKTALLTIVDSLNLWTTEAHLILDGFEENKSRAEQLRDQLAAKIVVAEALFDSLRASSVFDNQVDKFVKAKKVYGHSFNEWVGCSNTMFEDYEKSLSDTSLPSLKVKIDFSRIGISKDSLIAYLETARAVFNETYKYWLADYQVNDIKNLSNCFPAVLIPNLKIPIGVYAQILGIENGLSNVDDYLISPRETISGFKAFNIPPPRLGVPYVLADFENGQMYQGMAPFKFLFNVRTRGKREGLTTVEILVAAIAKPEFFGKCNVCATLDSYWDGPTCLRVRDGKLYDLDPFNWELSIYNYGCASCVERLVGTIAESPPVE